MPTPTDRRSSRSRVTASLTSLTMASLASAILVACGASSGSSGPGDPTSTPPVAGDEVRVVDNDFDPDHLEVPAGTEVTWVWESEAAHDVVGEDFDSGIQREGTFTYRFDEAGTYEYECTLHRGMTGAVTVVAP